MSGEALAAHFPGPITLRASKAKWLIVFAICAVFALGGAWMLSFEQRSWARVASWIALVFFGAGALVAIAMMLPGASSLTLAREGFEIVHLYRRTATPWQAASGFESKRVGLQKIVVYDDATDEKESLSKVNRSLVGRNAGLGDTYGLSADDLAALMRTWRARALTGV